jgi:predicted anti-sigma-YlaC factor YlaD
MDCTESITLLSEFHDGALDGALRAQVQTHLAECSPCKDIFGDLSEIVNVAVALNLKQELSFPDEDALWQRMKLADRKVH